MNSGNTGIEVPTGQPQQPTQILDSHFVWGALTGLLAIAAKPIWRYLMTDKQQDHQLIIKLIDSAAKREEQLLAAINELTKEIRELKNKFP